MIKFLHSITYLGNVYPVVITARLSFPFYFLALFSSIAFAHADKQPLELNTLISLSLDELSNIETTVTSAAKKSQNISEVPAAIYVISSEQIIRSGARSVADALALAPGVTVNKISEYNWQVSIRGLNEVLFNKALVMVDGRSVFSPLMSGTFWHTVDMVMSDIDRIEILRGTAGTMWGGNATNGVINIITKSSKETLGQHLEIAAGEHNYQEVSYRHGFTLNENTTARIFVKGVKSDYYYDNDDPWRSYRGGFRSDYQQGSNAVTLQFGGYHNVSEHDWENYNLATTPPQLIPTQLVDYSRGGYISVDWFQNNDKTDYEMHIWADSNSKVEPSSKGQFSTLNFDGLTRTRLTDSHELTTGGGVRLIHRNVAPYTDDYYAKLEPIGRYSNDPINTDAIYNLFTQLESQLSDNITTTLGVKVEHFTLNNTTEIQPQARITYQYSPLQQFWAGIGRAVVTPASVESLTDGYRLGKVIAADHEGSGYYRYYDGLFFTMGNPDMKNESVVTLDAGHRISLTPELNIDSTVFFSNYQNLRMLETGSEPWICAYGQCNDGTKLPNNLFIHETEFGDRLNANSYGFETAIRWHPHQDYILNTSYSFINTEAYCSGNMSCADDAMSGAKATYNHQPAHYLSVQSLWSINANWQFDVWFKHKSSVDSDITYGDGSKPYSAPEVTTVDVRLAWQKKPSWPKVEFIIDALNKAPYSDMPNKARIGETAYLRSSWDF
ncbi:TonB-dependent receptor plug domain-containing protein [Photobacterium sanguinicancri]|uniref:TonB-dependent receptor plug domain-containing protein n=1 Tax=Photobacterium sanguinicancri TaxID=875932 RepID=UPI0021C32284|nr:TonB-dependent receptor plug domain-containing protein [Photobacterium sanguinicancri]